MNTLKPIIEASLKGLQTQATQVETSLTQIAETEQRKAELLTAQDTLVGAMAPLESELKIITDAEEAEAKAVEAEKAAAEKKTADEKDKAEEAAKAETAKEVKPGTLPK